MHWFQRLADVPQVNYPGSPGIDRSRLPGYKAKPRIDVYEFGGEHRELVMWDVAGESSSVSPARRWQTTPQYGETSAYTILQQIYERLELPGTVRDYHFILQEGHGLLWSHRYHTTWVLTTVEQLCWIDIRLVEAYPDILQLLRADTSIGNVRCVAYEQLIKLYEHNGYLLEAFEVAARMRHVDPENTLYVALKTRIAHLEAEDVN